MAIPATTPERDSVTVQVALTALVLLAWLAVLAGGGTGMDPAAMSGWWLPVAAPPAFSSGWTSAYWLIALFMWAAMMVAMMLPSASPMGAALCPGSCGMPNVRVASEARLLQLLPSQAAISVCGSFQPLGRRSAVDA
jgi:predicted metal-binding membrane protein